MFDKGEGTIYEKLRISRMSRMVNTYRDDTLDRGGGTDYLTRRRGVYAEKLRISLIARMVGRDEGDVAEKRRRIFFSSLSREL